MEKSEKALGKLRIAVGGGQEFFKQSGTLPLEYVTDSVGPPLRSVLGDLCLQIEERHKVHETKNEKNNLFIHYTNIAALVSMLQDTSKGGAQSWLRLYDSVHFNDPNEGTYFSDNLNLPKKYEWLGKMEVSHAYIASFIIPNDKEDLSDNLVFWRTYGQEGTGCSLSLTVPRSRLQKVLYGPSKVKPATKALRVGLDSLDPLVRIRKQSLREVKKELARIVWESLEKFRYLYKSEAYKYENECRLVVAEKSNILGSDKNKICFEDRGENKSPAHIRHYYKPPDFEIKKLLGTGSSITLGPCVPHPYNVQYYLKTLMRRANLEEPEIKISKIPYRKF